MGSQETVLWDRERKVTHRSRRQAEHKAGKGAKAEALWPRVPLHWGRVGAWWCQLPGDSVPGELLRFHLRGQFFGRDNGAGQGSRKASPRTPMARSQEGCASWGPPTTQEVVTPPPAPCAITATAPPLGGLLQSRPSACPFQSAGRRGPGPSRQHPAGIGQLRLVQCLDAAHLRGQPGGEASSPPTGATHLHGPPSWAPLEPAQVTSPYQATPVSWTHTQASLPHPEGPRVVSIF